MKPTALLLALALAAAAAEPTLKVQIWSPTGYHIVDLPLEKYVAAALAGESSVFRSPEALKAMAVAARTYAIRYRGRHASEGFDLCATTHCQRIDLAAITPKLQALADATAGELLWYQGKLAFTPYSLDCGGRTEDAAAVWPDIPAPYLASHADPHCVRAGASPWRWAADPVKTAEALRRSGLQTPQSITNIAISRRTASGRAAELILEGNAAPIRISASTFRFAIGRELGWNTIRSDQYELHDLVFTGRGSGHGVGLCQRGADQMGVDGANYREILAFYYPGTEIGQTARGIPWTRLTGDHIALFTTQPARDSAALATAERELLAAAQRTHWPAPTGIELRIYPDVAAFRDATGEPGWVAAYTQGRRIHLQPLHGDALASTLRHELFHVLVELHAAPNLPLWFREGIVEYLSTPAAPTQPIRHPADAEFTDPTRARKAYADAANTVADFAHRHGEATLFQALISGNLTN